MPRTRSFTTFIGIFVALIVVLTGQVRAESQLKMEKDHLVVVKSKGKTVPLPEHLANIQEVENSDLRYVVLDPFGLEDAKLDLKPGVYFITPNNTIILFTGTVPPNEETPETGLSGSDFSEAMSGISLSPKGDIIALCWAPTVDGAWHFFTWPDMQYVKNGTVGITQGENLLPLLWVGDRTVVVDDMEHETTRPCAYDPCGPVTVKAFDLNTGKTRVLFKGTELCDYRVLGLENGKVAVDKLCLKKVSDWKDFPDQNTPTEKVFAPLP